jgi:hypothetical protein
MNMTYGQFCAYQVALDIKSAVILLSGFGPE